MSAIFDRRRAERFAQLLDEADGGRRHHTRSVADEQLTELVEIGQQLRTVTMPGGPSPEFRRDLRAMLMATAEREGIGVTAVAPEPDVAPTRPSRARIAIFSGVAAGALAISGVSLASGDANPGDALYGVKRTTEKAQLAMANSDLNRGQLYLEFARTRLGEANAVRTDVSGFASALGDMDDDTVAGVKLLFSTAVERHDVKGLNSVDAFVDDQRMLVRQLSVLTSGTSVDRVNESLNLLTSIESRSQSLRAALACGVGATGAVDQFGPIAGACPGTTTEQKNQQQTGTKQPNAPTGTAPSAQHSATPAPQPSESDDGGILGGLGRFLGDLLGG